MRIVTPFIIAIVFLAVLRAAVVAVVVAVIGLIVWGAIFRPTETYRFLAFCVLVSLLQAYPLICSVIILAVCLADIIKRRTATRAVAELDRGDKGRSVAALPAPPSDAERGRGSTGDGPG